MQQIYTTKTFWHKTAEHLIDLCKICKTHELLDRNVPDWMMVILDYYAEIMILHICQVRHIDLQESPEYYDMFREALSRKMYYETKPYTQERKDGPQLYCTEAEDLYDFLINLPIKWEKDRYGNWH